VNPGSSGGPLIDSHGELVGINSAIVGESYQGISFAIPARVAKEITQRIRSEGKVARGWLGIRLTEVSPEIAASEGLTQHDGAVVADFVSFSKQSNHGDRDNNARETADQSPAEKAGLQIGDVVLRWNDQPITKPATLTALVAATEIGTPATVVVRRAGQELTFTIHVGTRPEVK
jgi:serine protease Do